jgi:hypothetical protein
MNKLKPILLLTLVFCAGIAVGVVGTRFAVRQMVRTALERPEGIRLRLERRLNRQLDLTADQQARVHDILAQTQAQMRDLRQELRPRLAGVIGKANHDIIALLTPEQQERFERMKRENPLFWRAGQPPAGL